MHVQRTWMYSAILPGVGQIYNKKPIRAVVIWSSMLVFGYGAYYCHEEFVKYGRESSGVTSDLSVNYKKTRNIFLFLAILCYVANIFDAYVGANLESYDVSDDISLKMYPSADSFGLSLGFNWNFIK
jgi:hypothetical protein